MPTAHLDHLVVAAASLDEGVSWCEATLGVTPGPGGHHPLMGTHNRLLNVSGPRYPGCFLEIIAIDPDAAPPGRPRWFALDALDLSSGPRLIHAVARTPALDGQLHVLRAAGARPGEALAASRETPAGLLQWRITVAADGRPDGALPTLMQWDDERMHPTGRLPASGVTLTHLRLRGLRPAVALALDLAEVEIEPAGAGLALYEAELDTPRGPVRLRSA